MYTIDDCIPVAFGDFNADKNVDIFCRNTIGNTIRVMLNDDRSPRSKEQYSINVTGIIYDALAADFNGDNNLDLFVLYKDTFDQIGYYGGIFWGNRIKLSSMQRVDYLFESVPTTVDANGDSFVELLGMVSTNGTDFKPACVYLKNDTLTPIEFLPNIGRLRRASTQGSADLDDDFVADLFLTIESDGQPKYAIYQLPITSLTLIKEYAPPPDVAIYFLSSFADIDADGELEHILPVCMDTNCTQSKIFVRDDDAWYEIPIQFGDRVRFPLSDGLPSPFDQIPMSIKISDYDLDGYPDMVAIMEESSLNTTISVLLINQPCTENTNSPCTYTRKFIPQTQEKYVLAASNATLAAFFDILENGYPDLLVVQTTENQTYKLTGFQNSLVQDVHFMKVMILSSFECGTCSNTKNLPYGNNEPGQSIKMETVTLSTGIKDQPIKLAAVQMSQAGQLTLELPYVIIGLGPTPNFVEKLAIGLPPNKDQPLKKLVRTYTQLIPNSQVVIVPIPLMNPDKWYITLFITPSRMILYTGIALGVTLIVLAGVLAVFQYREKLEDDRERKVQAQAFHYDAL